MSPSRFHNLTRIPVAAVLLATVSVASAIEVTEQNTYRLYHGITAYVNNPEGRAFTLALDLRDINVYADGPREVLLKVYDPEGAVVVREIVADDGITSEAYQPVIGGWDHELDYYALCHARGTAPMIRWSAYSEPQRLAALVPRTFRHDIPAGAKGVYRVVLAGERDHFATVELDPALDYAVCGHHTFLHGRADQLARRYIYVPRGTTGLHLVFAEPDRPQARRFKLTAPDGKVLFEGGATGSYCEAPVPFTDPAAYADQVITLETTSGRNDVLVKVTLQREGGDYVGMGVPAIMAASPDLARALHGGALYEDGEVFWHPFQARFHRWLKANPEPAGLHGELQDLAELMGMIGPSDGRGSKTWTNWGYAFGYYGCRIWRPSWLLLKRSDVPGEVKAIIREALLTGGDRLSFAIGIERVNGNAFAQIPVALWYCHQATGDELQKRRFETYFERWRSGGWGKGAGISRSGDSQEHFAHDMHYGSYIMDNWPGGTWVKEGILGDTNDPRFGEVLGRIRELYSYLYCQEAAACPWSSRTHAPPHGGRKNWESAGHAWKAEPGPDFTVSVNDGNEWFAARRKTYYALTFHGRLAPEWMGNTFHGQLGFGGGAVCQLTVPGKGTVLASTLTESYGKGMHLANWRNFHLHSVVGEMWNGEPLVAAVSEHEDARLEGAVVRSSGEVRARPVRSARTYTLADDGITCEVQLSPTDYEPILTLWSKGRPFAHLREAHEMIPFHKATVTVDGAELTAEAVTAGRVTIARKGFGVHLQFEEPRTVRLGSNQTVLVELVPPGSDPVPAEQVGIRYRLLPYTDD